MKVTLSDIQYARKTNIATRCPHCGDIGTFIPATENDIHTYQKIRSKGGGVEKISDIFLGIRKCPNERCQGHLFFISNKNNILHTSPPQTIPFDKENIPIKVLNTFEEAVKCHSNSCYMASAIMIRKTLEEICLDKGASGKNLFKKLEDLGTKIIIPQELHSAMTELRLLGNDAAHIEAQAFAEIGKEEIEVSLELTKEILKAVYQYDNLLRKLKSLKGKSNQDK